MTRPYVASRSDEPLHRRSFDVLVLGGDIAGKMVVPILDLGAGHYRSTIQSITHDLNGLDELAAAIRIIEGRAYAVTRVEAKIRDAQGVLHAQGQDAAAPTP